MDFIYQVVLPIGSIFLGISIAIAIISFVSSQVSAFYKLTPRITYETDGRKQKNSEDALPADYQSDEPSSAPTFDFEPLPDREVVTILSEDGEIVTGYKLVLSEGEKHA